MSMFVIIPKTELIKLEEARVLLWSMLDSETINRFNCGQITNAMWHLANRKWEDVDTLNECRIPEGYSLVKNSALVEKGQPMPQTLDEWHNLAAGYDKAMLADKSEISQLKSELNNAKQQLESLRGKL